MLMVGFTGTSEPLTQVQQAALMLALRDLRDRGFAWLHMGDCISADHVAACLWRRMGGLVWVHPPSSPVKRAWFHGDTIEPPLDYMKRNHNIVQRSSEMVATPKESQEQLRSGTWSTIRKARTKGIITRIIGPDGNSWLTR